MTDITSCTRLTPQPRVISEQANANTHAPSCLHACTPCFCFFDMRLWQVLQSKAKHRKQIVVINCLMKDTVSKIVFFYIIWWPIKYVFRCVATWNNHLRMCLGFFLSLRRLVEGGWVCKGRLKISKSHVNYVKKHDFFSPQQATTSHEFKKRQLFLKASPKYTIELCVCRSGHALD